MFYVLTTERLDATEHQWLSEQSTFDYGVMYHSDNKNQDADGLSRLVPEKVVVQQDFVYVLCSEVVSGLHIKRMLCSLMKSF